MQDILKRAFVDAHIEDYKMHDSTAEITLMFRNATDQKSFYKAFSMIYNPDVGDSIFSPVEIAKLRQVLE